MHHIHHANQQVEDNSIQAATLNRHPTRLNSTNRAHDQKNDHVVLNVATDEYHHQFVDKKRIHPRVLDFPMNLIRIFPHLFSKHELRSFEISFLWPIQMIHEVRH